MGDNEPVYLLSLDGGGIRGISELVILHEIMERLQKVAGLKTLPKPRDYFHLIGGTSTGGLIAIMLGRMGMTTKEAIERYDSFAERVFRNSNRRLNRSFREKALERVIQELVTQRNLGSTAMINEEKQHDDTKLDETERDNSKGLAFVCAVAGDKMQESYLFRTYRGKTNHAHNVEIWEAARATTAAPGFFRPISIKVEASWDNYRDGALAFNNPAKLVLEEAESQFGPGRKLGFLLSLGTGLKTTDAAVGDAERINQHVVHCSKRPKKLSGSLMSRDSFPVFKHIKTVVTDPERTHHELEKWFQHIPNAYFRLNLDKGASDIKLHQYKKMGSLRTSTERYLKNIETSAMIDRIVSALHKKEGVEMPLEAACRATSYDASKHAMAQAVQIRTIASPQFTGRTEILNRIDQHFCERTRGSSPRRLLRIWGMGGVGKTQIALKFRDLCGSRFDHVFWIDAATTDSIYESFRTVTGQIFGGNPNRPNIKGVLHWMQQKRQEEWLLVFDNNDSIDVTGYVPRGDTGNILFTSRRKDMRPRLDDNQTFAVDVMSEVDAVALLLRASKRKESSLDRNDKQDVKQIIKDLGYLPLAIDQAGSYVDMQESTFWTYMTIFRKRREELLGDSSLYPGAFEDNPAVYGTFELSYEALEKRSKEDGRRGRAALNALRILNIFCFYHNENLTEEILSRASVYSRLDAEFIRGDGDGTVAPLSLLDRMTGGDWDPGNFTEGIMVLRSYSLIKKSVSNERWHSMHILIHSWARDRMNQQTLIFQRRAAREILFFSIYRRNKLDDELFNSQALPHLRACLEHGGEEHLVWMRKTEQEGKFARTLAELGLWEDATLRWEDIVADREGQCNREDWATIAGLWDLAKSYRDWGRLKKSEEVFEEIETLLPKCPQTDEVNAKSYDIYTDLAKLYIAQARYGEAKKILFHIFEREKPYGWRSAAFRRAVTTLATIIRLEGDTETALGLESYILDQCIEDDKTGPGHRMTMSAISNIAALRSEMGLDDKADEMWREVLSIDEDLRGKEHPITLQSKRNVATGSVKLGKIKEAEELLRSVLEVSERVLGADHLDTLTTMDQLAGVLVRQDKIEEALSLWRSCLEGRMCWLGDEHPLTIKTRQAISRLTEGPVMLVEEDFQNDGFLNYGDSNFVSQAERDTYLH